jgi:S-adenosylmethionine:tRNA ribosyltransferase-isomerase
MRVSDFDFELSPERIALRPASPREQARLLVVAPHGMRDLTVADLPGELRRGDVLVFNNTRVIPAALSGNRVGRLGTMPKIEALLHQRLDGRTWKAFVKPAKKLITGDRVRFGVLEADVAEKGEAGEVTLAFAVSGAELDSALAVAGRVPLPPYIESQRAQDAQDRADYQTVYARHDGAVAAPTAGLHFTEGLMKNLQDIGIQQEYATLHVGAGTFLPVKAEDTAEHKMHSEWGEVPEDVAARLRAARAEGRRVIAVGTTSLRLLEASGLEAFSGSTDIFITPGYRFRSVDGLFTNFHLPRSTLFMLVSAFAGQARMKEAYAHAIAGGYRFYSYGDASLLWPAA